MHRSRRPAVPDLQAQFSLYMASAGICYDVPSEGLYLVSMLAEDYCVVPDNRAVVVNTDSIQIGAFGERRYTLAVGRARWWAVASASLLILCGHPREIDRQINGRFVTTEYFQRFLKAPVCQ